MAITRWEELYAKSFKQLIKEIEQCKPDYYVPVARKSCKLLKSLKLPKDSSRVFYRKYFEFNAETLDLKGKKIAVIDDSCHQRAALAEHRKFFEEKGAKVKTFSFAGLNLKASQGEFSYDTKAKVRHIFSLPAYNEYLIQQDEFLQIQGTPLDIDHLVLRFELSINNGEIDSFLTKLRNYGYVYRIDQDRLPPSLMKFALDQPYFDEGKYLQIDSGLSIEGVRKIRFFVNKGLSKLYVIPMIFSALSSKFCCPDKCPLKNPIVCLHKLLMSSPKSKGIKEIICFYCLSLNLSAALAKCFFQVFSEESSLKFNTDSLNIDSLDYERFFGYPMAKKIINIILDFIQSKQADYGKPLVPISTSRVPPGFIVGTCSSKLIYLLRSYLRRGYERKKGRLKSALGVHFSLSFSEILKKYNEIPRWYLSQNLDFLCDHGILTPSIDCKKGVWLRTYRTGEGDKANPSTMKVKRTQFIIPFAITTTVEQLKLIEKGVRPFLLTKLLANFVIDHDQDQHNGLHCLEEGPNNFGADVFCRNEELTGGGTAQLKDCHLLGNKYYEDEVFYKGSKYSIYKAQNSWDSGFKDSFDDSLEHKLFVYFELLTEIAKLGDDGRYIDTGPLLSLSVNRSPERFLSQIYYNFKAWNGVFTNLLGLISYSENLKDKEILTDRIKFFNSTKSQPLVKLGLYQRFPNLLETLDTNFLTPLKYRTLYSRIRSSISTKRISKTILDRIQELGKLQNALADLFLISYSTVYSDRFSQKEVQLVPFDKAWKDFSSLYEKVFVRELDKDLKSQCLSGRKHFLDAMRRLQGELKSYFIDIPEPSALKHLIDRISEDVYQRAGTIPIELGIRNPVYIIIDMAKSKNKFAELGLTGYARFAAIWSNIIISQFGQFGGVLVERGEGDKLFVGFFPDIPKMVEAVARLFEIISAHEESIEVWPIHVGAAIAETLDREKRNNSYLKLAVAAGCCDHDENEKHLFVTEDFVKACPEKLRKYFCSLQPPVYIDEKDMKKQVHKKRVFFFLWESYASERQNFSKAE